MYTETTKDQCNTECIPNWAAQERQEVRKWKISLGWLEKTGAS